MSQEVHLRSNFLWKISREHLLTWESQEPLGLATHYLLEVVPIMSSSLLSRPHIYKSLCTCLPHPYLQKAPMFSTR